MTPADIARLKRPGLLVAATCLALAGCAVNPIAQWAPPEPKEAQPVSLGYAHRYADAARDGYQRALRDQVQAQVGLNSGLLGLGALAVGLAASSVHKDVVLGTAFLGGTVYAFGQQNLSKQRLLIYQAGVDAIGCAKRAVAPLAMSDADVKLLGASLELLERRTASTIAARAAVADALAAWNAQSPTEGEGAATAQAASSAAGSAIDTANRTTTSGRQAISKMRVVGDQLVNAVDKIDAAVVKATLDTLPDPSSVFKVIPGLAGFAGSIVPGADAAITAAMGKRKTEFTPQGKSFRSAQGKDISAHAAQLAASITKLNAETDQLIAQLAKVNGLLPSAEALASPDALRDCGVADVGFALKSVPEKVIVPAGVERTSFQVSGGVTPYVTKTPFSPYPVSAPSPTPHEGTVNVEIAKDTKPGTYSVTVFDSSKPAKVLVVNIEVQGAAAEAPDAPAAPQGKALTGASAVAQAISKKRQFQHAGGVELTLTKPAKPKSESEIPLSLRCNPKPAQCIPPADAAKTIVNAVGGDALKFQSALKPAGAGCICGS